MFIQTENTPNPATLKFLPGQVLMQTGTADFPTKESTKTSPLAAALFEITAVNGVFIGYDFVTVSKTDEVDWESLKPEVLTTIMQHLTSGKDIVCSENFTVQEHKHSEEDCAVIATIKELLDTRVRPAVAQDGGDIVFHGFEDGVVYLHMRGACAGCPSSTMTLKMGVENLMRHYIPEVNEVRAVFA